MTAWRLFHRTLLPLLWLAACGPSDPESAALGELVKAGYTLSVSEYHRAAASGDLRAMGLFLDSGVRIDVPLKQGQDSATALRVAVEAGQAGAVNWLLEREADVKAADHDPQRPLLKLAVTSGSEEVVRRLLALPDLPPVPLEPLLQASAAAGAAGIADALLEAGPAVEMSASLREAALAGHLAVVDLLLQKGAVLDAPDPVDGATALIRAAASGQVAVARLLLDAGASRWLVDHQDRLAADLAHAGGHEALASLLWHEPEASEKETGAPPEPASEPPLGWEIASAPAIPAANSAVAEDQPRQLPALKFAIVGHHSGLVKPPPARERLELRSVRAAMLPLRLVSAGAEDAAFEVTGLHGPPLHVRRGGTIGGTGWQLSELPPRTGSEQPAWVGTLAVIVHPGTGARVALTPAVAPRQGPLCAVLHISGTEEVYEGHEGDVFRFTHSPARLAIKRIGQRQVEVADADGVFLLRLKPKSD